MTASLSSPTSRPSLARKLTEIERKYDAQFKVVFELDALKLMSEE
jgi:hypothetical protein